LRSSLFIIYCNTTSFYRSVSLSFNNSNNNDNDDDDDDADDDYDDVVVVVDDDDDNEYTFHGSKVKSFFFG